MAASLRCPTCETTVPDRKSLVDHLKAAHQINRVQAWVIAHDAEVDAARDADTPPAPTVPPVQAHQGRRMCPRCFTYQPSVGVLANHLTKEHGVDPLEAVDEARGVAAPQDEEETPMPCG